MVWGTLVVLIDTCKVTESRRREDASTSSDDLRDQFPKA